MTPAILLAADPVWLVLIKVVVVFAFGMIMTLFMINWERKVVGRMQHRPGPNRVGPIGWLQALADGLKLAFKEDIRPVLADKWVYIIAPVVSDDPRVPRVLGDPVRAARCSIFGHQTALQLTDLPVGVLVVLACSSVGVYGIVLGRLVLRLALPAARRAALGRPGDLLRGRDGPLPRRGHHLSPLAVHRGHRDRSRAAGSRGCCSAAS